MAADVEIYRAPLPPEISGEDRTNWYLASRLTKNAAASKVVPKEYRDNPDAIFAVFWTGYSLGMALNLLLLRKFDVIDGVVEPRALTYWGLMLGAGHAGRVVELSTTAATVATRRRGENEESTFRFTIEEAAVAGLLDRWVERWTDTGERWPDSGKPKRAVERFTFPAVASDLPAAIPEWAQHEVDAGRLHRRDAWWSWRADMLMNRAAKRGARWTAPEILLGLDRAAGQLPDLGQVDIAPADVDRARAPELDPPAGVTYGPDDPTRPFDE